MISDRSIREYYKREHGIDLPENKNYGIDLSGSAFIGITDEDIDFVLENSHLDEEKFCSIFENRFGHIPNSRKD